MAAHPRLEQRAHGLSLVVHGGEMQRRVAALVPAVHLPDPRRFVAVTLSARGV